MSGTLASRPPRAQYSNSSQSRRLPIDFVKDPLGSLEQLVATQGDVARMKFGRRQAFVLNHPDLVQDLLITNSRLFIKGEGLQRAKRLLGNGLLTSEGDFHLRQRRLLQPVFLKTRIRAYASAMGRHASRLGEEWQDGQIMDMATQMNRLTLGVVAETLFSVDIRNDAQEIGRSLDTALELFQQLNSPWAPLLERLPFGPMAAFRKAKSGLDAVIFRILEDRKRNPAGHQDLLSLLLSSRFEDGTAMDPQQVRDEAMTILLAGHETTANCLTWTWSLLAQHPDVQQKLHHEALSVIGSATPGFQHVEQLVFTRQVISESMRLCPPAWIVGRNAITDYHVEHQGTGHLIPAGSIVAVSPWLLHHDGRFWSQPAEFLPERWDRSSHPKFAYFPFGAGSRQCIGENFAWMEAILLLASLSRHWRVELRGSVPAFQPRITLRPAGPLKLSVNRW